MWGAPYLSLNALEFFIFLFATIGAYCFGWLAGSVSERIRLEKLESEENQDSVRPPDDYNHLRHIKKSRKIYYPEILEEED